MKYLETEGAFCVATCFGSCSTKHLRAFSLSLHNHCTKRAKPEMILCLSLLTPRPCGCGTVLWAEPTSALGLQLSWGRFQQGATLPRSLLRKILVHHPENFLEQRPQSLSFPSISSSQAILVLSFQPFQPEPALVNTLTLPYTFSSRSSSSFLRHSAPD